MTSKTQNILFKKLEQAFEKATTNFIRKDDTYYYIRIDNDDDLEKIARAKLTLKAKRETFLEILEEIKQKFEEKNFDEEDINISVTVHTYCVGRIEVYARVCTGLYYTKVVRVVDLSELTKEQYQEYLRELETLKKIVEEQKKIVAEKNNEIKREKELVRLKEIENRYVKLKKIIQKLVKKEQLEKELAEKKEEDKKDKEEEEKKLTKEEIEFILQKVL